MFALVGCNNETTNEIDPNKALEEKVVELEWQNQESEKTIIELEQTIEDLQEQIATETILNHDLDQLYTSHKEQVSEILSYFSEEQVSSFAEDQWKYRLSVNDITVPKNGIFEVEADQIEISLSEQQPAMSVLSGDIFEFGQISGEFYHDHILDVTPQQDEETWRDGTVITGYGLIYTDLTPGMEIQLTITEELQKRLKFETDQVMIRIK